MAKYSIEDSTLTAIADAIRGKTGDTEVILTRDFPARISEIETGFHLEEVDLAAVLPASGLWQGVAYGGGVFVAVGHSVPAAYSTDGITWNAVDLPSTVSDKKSKAVAYGNGRFVVIVNGSDVAAYSDDGITWTGTTLPLSSAWYDITFGGGKFVAVSGSEGKIIYSDDGIAWATTTAAVHGLRSVIYGNGRFVAVGVDAGAYSDDGITWEYNAIGTGEFRVTFGDGRFVACSVSYGYIYYSNDGVTWNAADAERRNGAWYDITFGGGKFVAINYIGDVAGGVIYSDDGITWTAAVLPIDTGRYAITHGNGRFVIVSGDSREVIFSDDGVNWFNHTTRTRIIDADGTDVTEEIIETVT